MDPSVKQAVRELGINQPIMAVRVIDDKLELRLYGGQVVFWPKKQEEKKPRKRTRARSKGASNE